MWTAADQAELDVLLWALVDGVFEHRDQCARCAAAQQPGGVPCPHVAKAIQEVVDWQHARALRSRAEHLRALQEAA